MKMVSCALLFFGVNVSFYGGVSSDVMNDRRGHVRILNNCIVFVDSDRLNSFYALK